MTEKNEDQPVGIAANANFSIDRALESAIQNFELGNLQGADANCREILSAAPEHPIALHLLGVVALQTENFEAAETLISKAVSVQPDYADAHLNLGNLYQISGRLEDAAASFHQVTKLVPENLIAHINLANVFQELERFDDALKSYDQALKIDPNQAECNCNKGAVLFRLGRYQEAAASLTKALAIAPDFPQAQYNLGNVQMELAQYENAADNFGAALSHMPESADALYGMANAMSNVGRRDRAADFYKKAIAVRPNHARSQNNLGAEFLELGFTEQAIECFKKSIDCDPNYVDPWFNLHGTCYREEEFELAVEYLEKALSISPNNAKTRIYLGILNDRLGNTAEAEHHFSQLSSSDRPTIGDGLLDSWDYLKSASDTGLRLVGPTPEGLNLAIEAAKIKGLILEFGVRFGTSIRHIGRHVNQAVHGFDSFQGLPEAWHIEPEGSYSTRGELPEVPENVALYAGWFEESLPSFMAANPGPIRLINVDCDLYSSTKTIFDLLGDQIVPGTVIVFDEYFGNPNWREDEFKAFQEFVEQQGRKYDYLGASILSKQAIVIMR